MNTKIKPLEKDISTPFFRYRDCCRHLWNSYFLHLDESDDKDWVIDESFQGVIERLFYAMIAGQLYHRWLVKTADGYYDEVIVRPNSGPAGFKAMWVKPEPERQVYVWKEIQLQATANDFRFIEFFDWTCKRTMECQYVKARLVASDEVPELIGNDFLLEAWEVKFFRHDQQNLFRQCLQARCPTINQDHCPSA
jgi:hypothetical protein